MRFFKKKETEFVIEISSTFSRRCWNTLATDICIRAYFLEFYDVSAFIPRLQNVLFSKNGLTITDYNEIGLILCSSCYNSLPSGGTIEEKMNQSFHTELFFSG